MKLRLVDDASLIWKRWSIRIAAVGTSLSAAWIGLVQIGLADKMPEWVPGAVGWVVFGSTVLAGFLKQSNLPPAADPTPTTGETACPPSTPPELAAPTS